VVAHPAADIAPDHFRLQIAQQHVIAVAVELQSRVAALKSRRECSHNRIRCYHLIPFTIENEHRLRDSGRFMAGRLQQVD